jgi:hypothetical protein
VRERIAQRLGDNREPPFHVVMLNTILQDGGDVERLNIGNDLDVQKLLDTIRTHGLELVILDVLRELHDLPENEADMMAPLLSRIREITRATGCTILITHHHGYANRSRGSTSIRAAFDFEWSFVRTDDGETEEPPVGRLVIEGRMPKRVLRIRLGDGGHWVLSNEPPEEPTPGIREHILAALRRAGRPMTAEEVWPALVDPSYARGSVYNALAAMRQERSPPIVWQRREGKNAAFAYTVPQPARNRNDDGSSQSHEHMNGWNDHAEPFIHASVPRERGDMNEQGAVQIVPTVADHDFAAEVARLLTLPDDVYAALAMEAANVPDDHPDRDHRNRVCREVDRRKREARREAIR